MLSVYFICSLVNPSVNNRPVDGQRLQS